MNKKFKEFVKYDGNGSKLDNLFYIIENKTMTILYKDRYKSYQLEIMPEMALKVKRNTIISNDIEKQIAESSMASDMFNNTFFNWLIKYHK